MQKVIKSTNLSSDITNILAQLPFDKLFILTDENTNKLCYQHLESIKEIENAKKIVIKAGDDHKNTESLASIWKYLSDNGATRHSLLINLGGGMITDIGGFAAATFKRGIKCINIPTTLLGAVDAAVGGKTGINFNGLKNEIGAFAAAEAVIINAHFFQTLDRSNLMSGYAEMIKHGLISDETTWAELLRFDAHKINYDTLRELVIKSVHIKKNIVEQDPYEKNIRKALNLGHTIGHAFESLSYTIGQPLPHGYAVAWGIICELYLSFKKCNFPKDKLWQTLTYIKQNYEQFHFDSDHYEALHNLMKHDKKNETTDKINFTLLENIGQIALNQTATEEEIYQSIDFLRESLGM